MSHYDTTTPMDMARGSEGFTVMSAVHPASQTISFDAPIYSTPDAMACVMVTRAADGRLEVWADDVIYPTPSLTGVSAQFHLVKPITFDDLADVASIGGWS